jgi:hypothetical protein
MRCVVNEIITMNEAVARGRYFQGLPDRVTGDEPYWDFYFEALDAKWARDDQPLSWKGAGKLFKVDGNRQDNTQRPALVATGFSGKGLSVFPGDPEGKFNAWCAANAAKPDDRRDGLGTNPSYDASKVVGRAFDCEEKELVRDNFTLKYLVPVVVHPEGYLFTGEVRVLGSADSDGANPVTNINSMVDITRDGGEEELAKVLALISGKSVETADFLTILTAGGVDNRTLLDGESITGVALNDGALVQKLSDLGKIKVVEGKVAIA